MTDRRNPILFRTLIGLALVWNLMGVLAFFGQVLMSDETFNALPAAEQALYSATPLWVNLAFAVAVFGGAIGCLLLLLSKPVSFYILLASLVGACVQMAYIFLVSKTLDIYGPGAALMPAMIIVIAVALVWFSRHKFKTA